MNQRSITGVAINWNCKRPVAHTPAGVRAAACSDAARPMAMDRWAPLLAGAPSSRDVNRRVKGRRLSAAETVASRAGRAPEVSGTRYLDSSSGALHQRTWCGGEDPERAVAATAPFSSSSWMMSPPPSPANRPRATTRRVPIESADERREFHPSVLRMGSPTQVRLGAGQVAATRRPRDRIAAQESLRLSGKSSSESGTEAQHGSTEPFRTPPRAHQRSAPSAMPVSPRQRVDRGGLLFIDDIAVRDMRLSRGSVAYPWLRFSFGSQPSKYTAPYRIGSADSDTASWNEHLAIDIPPGGGDARVCVLTVELWLQPRSGQGNPNETSRSVLSVDGTTTRHSPDVFWGRTEINVDQLLANGATGSSQEGWFKLSGDAGSLHVLLRFTAARSPGKDSVSKSSLTAGDDAEDGNSKFLPVNAVMLRLYWDKLLIKRVWVGWISHHRTRRRLHGYIVHCQKYSQAARRRVQMAFEQWRGCS
eukprot:COSAG03_NODE_3778_length_1832_cov_1.653203_2_plen_475_part_01